jgi:hypothetical protein
MLYRERAPEPLVQHSALCAGSLGEVETVSPEEITQIRVGGFSVGFVGLREVMESMRGEYSERPDIELEAELLSRIGKKNYIPDRASADYGKAFLREFKRFLGKSSEEGEIQGLSVKVLGMGCVQCDRLEREVISVMSEAGLTGDVEHVRDLREIGKYGIMGSPALIINNQVKAVGKVPPRSKIREWLKEATIMTKRGP